MRFVVRTNISIFELAKVSMCFSIHLHTRRITWFIFYNSFYNSCSDEYCYIVGESEVSRSLNRPPYATFQTSGPRIVRYACLL